TFKRIGLVVPGPERLDLRVNGAVGRIDQVDLGVLGGRVVYLERVPARRGQLPPHPPLDTAMRFAGAAPPLHAVTPAVVASAAARAAAIDERSAARRTL